MFKLLQNLLIIIILTECVFCMRSESEGLVRDERDVKDNQKQYQILFWNKYFKKKWSQKIIPLTLDSLNCSYSNCNLTEDKDQMNRSDVLLIHWRNIDVNNLPKYHSPDQKWVLFNEESPEHTSEDMIRPLNGQIDWTMTYRLDSDIPALYGSVNKCTNKWQNEDLFDGKNESIAWVVSNCETPSKRESYVEELKRYIDVHIYGDCGPFPCPRDTNDTCFKNIEKNYKFYLSFENSLCKDYVTEKFFRTLTYDIIPIVYGSADYKQIITAKAYINTMDFGSPKELADYLKVIANDKQKYNSYMQWKNDYCSQQYYWKKLYFCDLCEKVNLNSKPNSKHQDLIDWWYKEGNCVKGPVFKGPVFKGSSRSPTISGSSKQNHISIIIAFVFLQIIFKIIF